VGVEVHTANPWECWLFGCLLQLGVKRGATTPIVGLFSAAARCQYSRQHTRESKEAPLIVGSGGLQQLGDEKDAIIQGGGSCACSNKIS
jgi:hypothetical protein